MKGVYVLVINLRRNRAISVGRNTASFKKGFYAYVGSAMNSLENRIGRHLRKSKKLHWHIDYLMKHADIMNIVYSETEKKFECLIARGLSKGLEEIKDFGCSDCSCSSHLFFGNSLRDVNEKVTDAFKRNKLVHKTIKIN